MSKQKRACCRQRFTCPVRAGKWSGIRSARYARHVWAFAGGATAPFWTAVWLSWAWVATEFLHKVQPIRQCVQPAFEAELPGLPPPLTAGRIASRGKQARPRSSLPLIPFPLPHSRLHWTLPLDPAQLDRAERYDGKRDLYFQHAA